VGVGSYAGKAALLNYRYRTQVVDHPAVVETLGAPVIVRGLSGAESITLAEMVEGDLDVQAGQNGAPPTVRFKSTARLARTGAWAIRFGWIDEAGNQVLSDDDIDLVLKLPEEVIDAIGNAIQALSGQTRQRAEALKKSSNATTPPASGTPLPSPSAE
jgi:hypothetical protein